MPIWKYKQKLDINEPINWLKWGLHSARITRYRFPTHQEIEIYFFYKDKPVKYYVKRGNLTDLWVEEQSTKYFNSVYLDREMYGKEPEIPFSEIDRKYRYHTETKPFDK